MCGYHCTRIADRCTNKSLYICQHVAVMNMIGLCFHSVSLPGWPPHAAHAQLTNARLQMTFSFDSFSVEVCELFLISRDHLCKDTQHTHTHILHTLTTHKFARREREREIKKGKERQKRSERKEEGRKERRKDGKK